MELIDYLINAKNLPAYDREPAIAESDLDDLIKKFKGDKKIYEINYQYDHKYWSGDPNDDVKCTPIKKIQYTVGSNIKDPKVQENYEWYINSDLYYNVSIQEQSFN